MTRTWMRCELLVLDALCTVHHEPAYTITDMNHAVVGVPNALIIDETMKSPQIFQKVVDPVKPWQTASLVFRCV